uniref:EF-hand domain-containing protein n=2 Tax=Palpitomonas bilix TaxID=652834 RepID=A0A7S3CXG6_9EUKA|mmetsp:Transcript_13361/g.35082  ORF Transcript_13361/g.35082 Transcript_13361/m.35082 type:complete len:119 (+) Transcript_13361:375-731(+)
METLGLKPSQEELDAMIKEIDIDGNGSIEFDEFVQVMSRKVQPSYTPEEVKSAFKVFETPGEHHQSGYVSLTALEKALTTYGTEKLSAEDAQELLSQIDVDANGLVNYVEYVNMMTSG